MFEEANLQWENHQFRFKGEPVFLNKISRIPLDLTLGSSLKWDLESVKKAKRLLFELDFGLGEAFPSMEDMAPFLSLGLGLDAFGKVAEEFEDRVVGAVLLKSDDFFSVCTAWDDELLNDLKLFFKSLGLDEPKSLKGLTGAPRLALEIFARDTVMGYVSLLASQLPSAVAGLIDIEGKGLTPLQEGLLFLPSTLGGLHLVNREEKALPTIGILVPELSKEFIELMPRFDAALKKLRALGLFYRFVSAEQFHEGWELLDIAIGLPGLMSESAQRQCIGFSAAGGKFVSLGGSIEGLSSDLFEDFVTGSAAELMSKAKQLRDLNRQRS